MVSTSLSYRYSFSLLIKTWIAERLENVTEKLSQWIVKSITSDFKDLTMLYGKLTSLVDGISSESAKRKLVEHKRYIESLESFEKSISHLKNEDLRLSYKSYKKALFKYEARLHRIATRHETVCSTDEPSKRGLSELNRQALNKLLSNNAIS